MDDARLLMHALPDACLGRIFVLFPDPWPKTRHHKRRIVNPGTAAEFARLLAAGGELRLATDDLSYARAMLLALRARPELRWQARRPGDWRSRPTDWPPTRYGDKALAAGRACVVSALPSGRRTPSKALEGRCQRAHITRVKLPEPRARVGFWPTFLLAWTGPDRSRN